MIVFAYNPLFHHLRVDSPFLGKSMEISDGFLAFTGKKIDIATQQLCFHLAIAMLLHRNIYAFTMQ